MYVFMHSVVQFDNVSLTQIYRTLEEYIESS